jgi:hypothetical protein
MRHHIRPMVNRRYVMSSFTVYVAAGGLFVLAMDFIAPSAGTGLRVAAWPTIDDGITHVDRTHKSDRLTPPATVVDKRHAPVQQSPRVLIGCDPVFSPFSSAARLNFSARCVADVASTWKTPV